jgi:hypothetical protein
MTKKSPISSGTKRKNVYQSHHFEELTTTNSNLRGQLLTAWPINYKDKTFSKTHVKGITRQINERDAAPVSNSTQLKKTLAAGNSSRSKAVKSLRERRALYLITDFSFKYVPKSYKSKKQRL